VHLLPFPWRQQTLCALCVNRDGMTLRHTVAHLTPAHVARVGGVRTADLVLWQYVSVFSDVVVFHNRIRHRRTLAQCLLHQALGGQPVIKILTRLFAT
jgi:hypothetical protein